MFLFKDFVHTTVETCGVNILAAMEGGAAASRDVQYHIFLTEYEYSLLSNI